MQAGGRIAVRARAARPDGAVVQPDGPQVLAAFYAPGKDPEHVVADRVPDAEVPLAFDAPSRLYGAEVSTAGWAPGNWTVRAVVLDAAGVPAGWSWATFPLEP